MEVMTLAIIFTCKIFDNALGTAKSIFLNKEKYVLSSFFQAASTAFYMFAVVKVVQSNDPLTLVVLVLATFIGALIPGLIYKKSIKETLYVFDITADTMENGKKFADTLRAENVKITTLTVHDQAMSKTLSIKAYCKTKTESKKVNDLICPEFRYNVYAPINFE